jgi:hypothetical protein
MKHFYLFLLFLLLPFICIAQIAKSPYPIIFIHGITSDYTLWEQGNPSVKTYLESIGLKFGGVVDVTLDYLRDTNSLRNSIDQDVHRFPINISAGDFYFLNFAVHSSGYSKSNDPNYPYPINQIYQDMLSAGDLPVLTTAGEYHIGDIIRVENEFMIVNEIGSNYLGVTRGGLNSTALPHIGGSLIYNLSNESNQASIAKQGWGLKLALDYIKTFSVRDTFIVVGHSMGGLTAREYIRSNYYQNDIAKLVTVGTPHLGSKADEVNIWWRGNPRLDPRSDAMRDLRYNYDLDYHFGYDPIPPYGDFPDLGIYLFGGFETMQIDGYYSTDFNGNGQIDNTFINGLSKNLSTLPSSIDYTWIVSKYGILDGDIAVRLERQYPWDETGQQVGDTLMMYKIHNEETKDVYSVVRGLDEPDTYQLAYKILSDVKYLGYMQFQTNYKPAPGEYNPPDLDYYRFIATSNGKLKITVDGSNSGVNGIILLDQSGNLVNYQSIESFPFIYEMDVNAGVYYVGITGNAPSNVAHTPYTILPTLEPLIIYLYNGFVAPQNGDETTDFNFSVSYKNTNNVPPDNVQLHIINETSYDMTPSGSDWQQGVQFTKTLNNFVVGQYEYYYSATVGGQQLRFPETGFLNFSVIQNVAGWDIGVDIDGTYLQPSAIGPGTTITVNCDIQNFSNTGNTYINVPLSVELRSPSGQLLDQNSTTIPSLASGVGQIYPLNLVCPGDAVNGNYSIIITVSPMIDNNPINNSLTLNFYIGPSIGTELYESAKSEIFLYIDDTFNVCGQTFKLAGVFGGNQATIQEPSGTLRTINKEHIRVFTSYNCAIAVASVGSNYATVRVLCAVTTGGPTYSNKEIIGYPGQQNIYFDVSAPASRTFLWSSSDYGDIYTTGTSTNLPRDWFDGINLYNSNQNVKIRFDIPSSASTGTYVFYQPTKYQGLTALDHFTKVQIKIVAQPPSITSLSSYNFSADDELTIIGTGFGSSGAVNFNDLVASQIVSWSTTQIKAKVPVGVQSGNLFVSNSNRISNAMAYTVKSSTGAPVVIAPIPDQSIYQGETKLIASLNNVFSEPNNQVMTFSATSSNLDVLIDQNLLTTAQLNLVAQSNATGTATITINATDPDNKTASDEFIITVIPTQQSFITLTSPNGGEDWAIGSPQNITWVSNGTSGNVKIEMTRDDGINWEVLYANTPDDETENWTVTGPITNLSKIKISDLDGNPFDVSDNAFNIIVQNVPPTLTWSGETGYESDGVNPNDGNNTATFTFRVKYSDADNNAPLYGYPCLHIKKSGVELAGPYTMNEANTDPFASGRIYTVTAGPLEVGADYTYYFEAMDVNNNLATGEATLEQNGPVVTNSIEQYTEQSLINLTGVFGGSVAWGDYDNDSDLDVILTGTAGLFGNAVSKIYSNEGNNIFLEQTSIVLTGLTDGSAEWGDYDNDGYLDILLTGSNTNGTLRMSKIYHNGGDNSFTELPSINLTGVSGSSSTWADYNNDGKLDITITGFDGSNRVTKIYRNEGGNIFSEQTSISLSGVSSGTAAWGDYDNDRDLDLLLTGFDGSSRIAKIYRNDGNSQFTEQTSISLPGVQMSSAKWGDYDSDGNLDIIMNGSSSSLGNISKIFKNTVGDFVEQTSLNLIGTYDGSAIWGDYNNDGHLDILISGNTAPTSSTTKLYSNEGENIFLERTEVSLVTVGSSSMIFGDYDNDADLDLLISGYDFQQNSTLTKIYSNNNITSNTATSLPTNLISSLNGQDVTLSWTKSTDIETPQNGLTYNLRIGITPDGCEVLSPMSDPITGKRRIVGMGNTNHNNSWAIKGLAPGTYYWSVQAIDNTFAGSAFAEEQSFIIQQPAIVDFALDLNILDNCLNTINLQLGTVSDATDGFDLSYDQLAPPSPPVTNIFDGRLRINSEDYLKDFRATNSNGVLEWNIIYQPEGGCSPITLSWNASELPANGFFTLVDGITNGQLVSVDMKSINSFTDNIGLGNMKVIFKYTKVMTSTVASGWNMLSLPITVVDAHYQTLFLNATIGTLYGFNSSYFPTDTMRTAVKGYWLRFPGNESVTMEGEPVDNISIPLNVGWNIIGSIFCDVALSTVSDPGGIITPGTLYGFEGSYYPASTIIKGKAFWLRANASGEITLDCQSQVLPKVASQSSTNLAETDLSSFSKIEIRDGNEIPRALHFSGKLAEGIDKESYSLPPVAPIGAFDVRLNGGYKLVESEEVTINIQSSKYPVRVKIDGNGKLSSTEGFIVKELSGGIEISSDMIKENQELVINDSRVNMITIKKGQIVPAEYILEQNYPNPFNPTTTIKFGLPEATRVKVRIYNMLGELIMDLVDKEMDAGYHKVDFNASGIASGVYLYRIETTKFSSVKKMMIIK